jgi:hypothetical protein
MVLGTHPTKPYLRRIRHQRDSVRGFSWKSGITKSASRSWPPSPLGINEPWFVPTGSSRLSLLAWTRIHAPCSVRSWAMRNESHHLNPLTQLRARGSKPEGRVIQPVHTIPADRAGIKKKMKIPHPKIRLRAFY